MARSFGFDKARHPDLREEGSFSWQRFVEREELVRYLFPQAAHL